MPPTTDSPADSRIARIYDTIASDYVRLFFNDRTDSPWLDRLVAGTGSTPRVLDIGCGPGNFSSYLADRGCKVVGIDISERMLELARVLVPGAEFTLMDCRVLSFPSSSFEACLTAYSLLHLSPTDTLAALIEIHRVLAPAGVLALMLKEGTGEQEVTLPLASSEKARITLWSRADVRRLLDRCGFVIEFEESAPSKSAAEIPAEKLFFLARRT